VRKHMLSCLVALPLVMSTPMLLQGCVAPALMLSPQSQLMWALLKPMVGLDPKEVNLFKQELVRSRLQPLLGQHYETAVQLLETAEQIQQEGPLFYVASKYTPLSQVAEKAGFVWNSETNQMAVLLVSGGAPQIFAEKLNDEVAAQVPAWPKELAEFTDPDKLKQKALSQASQQADAMLPDEVKQIKNQAEQVKAQADGIKKQVDDVKKLPKQAQQQVTEQLKATNPLQQVVQESHQVATQTKQITDEAKQQAHQGLQPANQVNQLVNTDDLLAEVAAEHQESAKSAQRAKLQQQLDRLAMQLAGSKDPSEIKTLQQQQRQIQQQLDALLKE